jgi:hypothetical protein
MFDYYLQKSVDTTLAAENINRNCIGYLFVVLKL